MREQRCSVSLGLISSSRLLKFAKVHYINERYPRSNHTGHASADLSPFFFLLSSFICQMYSQSTLLWCVHYIIIIASKYRPDFMLRALLKRCNCIHNCFTSICPQATAEYILFTNYVLHHVHQTHESMYQIILHWAYQLASISYLFVCVLTGIFYLTLLPDVFCLGSKGE